MKDNKLIRNDYLLAIKNFENEIGKIDKKYCTFAKIEIDFDCLYRIGVEYPPIYFRHIELAEILIK